MHIGNFPSYIKNHNPLQKHDKKNVNKKMLEEKPDALALDSLKKDGKEVKKAGTIAKLAVIGTGIAATASSIYLLAHPNKAPQLLKDVAGKAPKVIKNALTNIGKAALAVEDNAKIAINKLIKDETKQLPLSNQWHSKNVQNLSK